MTDDTTATADTEIVTEKGALGMPWWFYLVILDAIVVLAILVWIVTQNSTNLNEYFAATDWALKIMAFFYLAVALFGVTRTAIQEKPINIVAWGLMAVIALAILETHWVALAGIALVMIAHIVVAGLARSP